MWIGAALTNTTLFTEDGTNISIHMNNLKDLHTLNIVMTRRMKKVAFKYFSGRNIYPKL